MLSVWISAWLVFVALPHCQSLDLCSTDSTTTIIAPCKFTPGDHTYLSLVINSRVYFETSAGKSRHKLQVTQTLEIQAKGELDVGYNLEGSDLGAGATSGSGGSYGGRGGTGTAALTSAQAVPYGDPFNVGLPGSKGGGGGSGKGGGLLIVQAGKLVHEGVIRVTGQRGSGDGGGGSGGGMNVSCHEIDGGGRMEAVGGLGGSGRGGGGSGGRISVSFKQGAFRGKIYAHGGKTAREITVLSGSLSATSELYIYPVRYSAAYATLDYRGQAGGWMPSTSSSSQYLEVTLNTAAYVTDIATQGRYGGSEWVTSYYLEYQSFETPTGYFEYTESAERQIFAGNSDSNAIVKHELATPVYARSIRFRPLTWRNNIAMRVQVSGYPKGGHQILFVFRT